MLFRGARVVLLSLGFSAPPLKLQWGLAFDFQIIAMRGQTVKVIRALGRSSLYLFVVVAVVRISMCVDTQLVVCSHRNVLKHCYDVEPWDESYLKCILRNVLASEIHS